MRYFLALFLFALLSCSSFSSDMKGQYIEREGINSSVKGILKAFQFGVPGGVIRGRSKNGRQVVSAYRAPKGNQYEDATNKKIRAYVKLSIRGSRRPYTLRLQYVIQKRMSDGAYKTVKLDNRRAREVLVKMREYLATRPDRSDFIDDFRAF